MNDKKALNLEKFDSYLELADLIRNTRNAASFIKRLKTVESYEKQIKTLVSYLIENEEIMSTNSALLQAKLCKFFVYAFNLTNSANTLLEDYTKPYLYRLFHLLACFFSQLSADNDSKYHLNKNEKKLNILLQKIGKCDLFLYVTDQGSQQEIFDSFINIRSRESVNIIVSMVNNLARIPNFIAQRIYGLIYDTIVNGKGKDNIILLIENLSDIKKKDVVQNIKNFLKGAKSIKVFEKVSMILNLPSEEIYKFAELDLQNEDSKARLLALQMAINSLFPSNEKSEFMIGKWEKYETILGRHNDNISKIRIGVVSFAFDLLEKMKQKSQLIMEQIDSTEREVFESTKRHLNLLIWNIIKEHIVDKADEVRYSLMKKLYKIDINEIKLDYKLISFRLMDKSHLIRPKCLKILVNLHKSFPEKMTWIFQTIVDLYMTVKDISLYGLSLLIEDCSIVDVIHLLDDKKTLYLMLRDIYDFQKNIICSNEKIQETNVSKTKFFDQKKLTSILRVMPKNIIYKISKRRRDFIDNDGNNQQKYYNIMKTKIPKEDVRLLLGLCQPMDMSLSNLLKCDDLDAVKSISKIYGNDFVSDILMLLNEPNQIHLLILSTIKKNDSIDRKEKIKVLQSLIGLLNKSDELKEKLIIKSFAHFVRKDDFKLLGELLDRISLIFQDDIEQFQRKLFLYSHFTDKDMIPKDFNNEIEKNLNKRKEKEWISFETEKKTIKNILKIISNENSERNVEIHIRFIEEFPEIVFKSLINNAHKCFNYVSPTIYRQIAYSVIQNEYSDVREKAISDLNESLKQCTTPIQFLALFTLSATDPTESNRKKAKEYFENQVVFRRNLIKKNKDSHFSEQIAPETVLPYVINLLAHHHDFSIDNERMLTVISTFSSYLKFFLEPICANQKNYPKLLDILFNLQLIEDIESEYTENMYKLCELASSILKIIGNGREWNNENNLEKFSYSKRYFKEVENKEDLYNKLVNSNNDKYNNKQNKIGYANTKSILRSGMLALNKSDSNAKFAQTKKKEVSTNKTTKLRKSIKIKNQDKISDNEEKTLPTRIRIRAPSPSLISNTFRPV